jgi:hypothetical protein
LVRNYWLYSQTLLTREENIMDKIKVVYDAIVGWFRGHGQPGDADYIPSGPADRCHHFIVGKPGDPISGGIYIKLGVEIPETITLFMPYMPQTLEPPEK